MFDFPTKDLLTKISTTTSLNAINCKLGHFIRLKCYELMGIRYLGGIHQDLDENGKEINVLTIEFTCCKKRSK